MREQVDKYRSFFGAFVNAYELNTCISCILVSVDFLCKMKKKSEKLLVILIWNNIYQQNGSILNTGRYWIWCNK